MYLEPPHISIASAVAEEVGRLAVPNGDRYSPKTIGSYNPPSGLRLLREMRSTVQRYSPEQIYPCNSFGRIAYHGAELREHKDRPGLDWTVSIMVHADEPWGIEILEGKGWRSYESMEKGILMESGRLLHRREPYTGQLACQLFLHYTKDPARENDA